MGEKLKPRVGDRVVVQAGTYSGYTIPKSWMATVEHVGDGTNFEVGETLVAYDPPIGSLSRSRVPSRFLEVRDREPAKWPEGWGAAKFDNAWRVWPPWADDAEPYGYLTRELFDRIRGPEGDYMNEHWDELMGDR
jgi:hypothetical protein